MLERTLRLTTLAVALVGCGSDRLATLIRPEGAEPSNAIEDVTITTEGQRRLLASHVLY